MEKTDTNHVNKWALIPSSMQLSVLTECLWLQYLIILKNPSTLQQSYLTNVEIQFNFTCKLK